MENTGGTIIGTREEKIPQAAELLAPVMEKGRPRVDFAPLEKIREAFRENFKNLDPAFKDLDQPAPFDVQISPALLALQKQAG